MVHVTKIILMVHIAETMEGEKGSYITETMERQHGGLVLSVHEPLTRTVYMIYIATLRLNPLQCTYYC